jgi:hypothetical protein
MITVAAEVYKKELIKFARLKFKKVVRHANLEAAAHQPSFGVNTAYSSRRNHRDCPQRDKGSIIDFFSTIQEILIFMDESFL